MKRLLLLPACIIGLSFAIPAQAKSVLTLQNLEYVQDSFAEISADALPEPVKTALLKAYPNATVVKAWVNDKKEYKIEFAVNDQKATVIADANGNWIKI